MGVKEKKSGLRNYLAIARISLFKVSLNTKLSVHIITKEIICLPTLAKRWVRIRNLGKGQNEYFYPGLLARR